MSKDAYYFSHDANARRDPRIAQMMSVYGFQGYGWYWALVEMMREQAQYKLDISGKYFYHGLANELSTSVEQASTFINDCTNEFKLFNSDGNNLWSESLLNRMRKYQKLVEQRREAGRMSAQKRKDNKDKLTPVEHPLNTKATEAQQLKETKLKETKGNKEKDNTSVSGDKITFDRSTRKFDGITPDYLSYLKEQYPAVDIDSRLRDMEAWLDANPKNQKSNYKRFITNWLKREQDKAPRVQTGAPHAKPITQSQEAERNMLKNELSALYQKLENKKEVPEGHTLYNAAQRSIVKINERIDEIEAQLKELEG